MQDAVTDSYEYDAFGNALVTTGSTPNEFLYRGEQYDSDLGLYYLRARYYNPATGRFMSRDPENGKLRDPASLHKYFYADGDPVNRLDPRGRGTLIDFMIQIAVPVAVVATAAVLVESFASAWGLLEQSFHEPETPGEQPWGLPPGYDPVPPDFY